VEKIKKKQKDLNRIKIGLKIEKKNETGWERAVFLELIFKGGKGLEK
jgi:hypothetical protein